jgi:hypothetical protein
MAVEAERRRLLPGNGEMTAMVDAAMVEMRNIHPPLRRSECERLIHAAIDAARSGGKGDGE